MTGILDWDRLALVWRHFEASGLAPRDLEEVLPRMRAGACVVIGAGQGYVTSRLRSPERAVISVDSSLAMLRESVRRRSLAGVVADGVALPLPEGFAAGLIVSTGVLNPANPASAGRLLEEAVRVLRPDGVAAVAAFVLSGSWAEAGTEIGIIDGVWQRNDRLLELYRSPSAVREERVASWTRVSLTEAAQALARQQGVIAKMAQMFERVSRDLEARGIDPAAFLESAFGRPLAVFRKEELERLVAESGLAVEEVIARPLADGIALLVCRPR